MPRAVRRVAAARARLPFVLSVGAERRSRRAAAAVLVVALIAACGGDDGAHDAVDARAIDAAADGAIDAPPGPRQLSSTGLYSDLARGTIAPGIAEYAPAYPLWSDGAQKRRWIQLPPGTQIDTRDMDHWTFPVGTKLWKEFARDGVRLETRLVEHVADTGRPETDYWMGAFLWLDDQSDAVLVEGGATDVHGTAHDVPAQVACWTCHGGEPGHGLSFSAVQLSKPGAGPTLATLTADALLSDPPPVGADFSPPGAPEVKAALGYLHANCGHCHNPHGSARPDVDLMLRLDVAARTPEATATYRTAIGVPLQFFHGGGLTTRIVPGDQAASAVTYRMSMRGMGVQMPPIATEHVDTAGLAAVTAWIAALPP